MMIQADRLVNLPPYLFEEIDRRIQEAKNNGIDIISFGIGDPDLPTPTHIVEACSKSLEDARNHRYPSSQGKISFREAVALRYKEDFGVSVDPENEVSSLIGSKEGIHNIHLAYINPGDTVLSPNPGYPVYGISPSFSGGRIYSMPIIEDNNFLPNLESIPAAIARKAKIIWLNYPNNPTAATAEKPFYKEVLDFAKEYDLIICSDEAYSSIAFDGYRPISMLEVDKAHERTIVFNSLSKTYNMTGWRIGYALGNPEIVGSLVKLKGNVDSGASQFIQDAATTALTSSQDCVKENVLIYQKRRNLLVDGLQKIGYKVRIPKATFYLWLRVPREDSMSFANKLLSLGIVVTPGIGFGEHGKGFVRFALTQKEGRIKEALDRIEGIS
jgi:LL-diaminopimelate aminotransferase